MFSFCLLCSAVNGIDALVLSYPQTIPQTNATKEPSSFTAEAEQVWLSNDTATLPIAAPNDFRYICSPGFGVGLSSASCYDAVANSGLNYQSTVPMLWGPRGTIARYDFPIPQWFVSYDGACIVQAVIAPSQISALASQKDVGLGAVSLIDSCADATPSMGGLVTQLGPRGKFGVILAKGDPKHVRCYGSADVRAIANSCQAILDGMVFDDTPRTFGTDAMASVRLPWTRNAADGRCYIALRTSGPTDIVAWSEVWEAGVYIVSMCAKRGQKGLRGQMGVNNQLYLEVGALPEPETVVAATS